MSGGHFEELKTLFLEACGLEADAQSRFVHAIRQRNPELADKLDQLLAQDTSTDHQLFGAVNAVASNFSELPDQTLIGQTLGPYRLIEKIGQGGMGAVYRADRNDGEFEHQVAIKLIGTHAFSQEMIDRFRNERQILAHLNHPNIARILDGGTSKNGTTYLVMELIEGKQVTEYCDSNNLTVRQRLSLFLKLCQAIEFAHRNLVVHRDIKPSNILVTNDGIAKVLDFGIAKLLDNERPSEDDAPATVIAITPDYSSPEQIMGLPVTTSCDVYSLGVLLFEMLTGLRPYQRQGKRLSEIENDVLHTSPKKPSQVLLNSRFSGKRNSVTSRVLKGDLDTLVIGALRRETKDRYQSVSALASDVSHYLAGKPIAAKNRSFSYVATKFLQRNRWTAALACALLFTSAGAGFFHVKQIGAERDRVFQEARKSAAVTRYLESLFEITGPNETNGEDISAQDVLDRGARRLDAELSDQPEIRARLLTSIGVVYANLGLSDKGIRTTEKAIKIGRTLDRSPQILRSLASAAKIHRLNGDFEAASAALEEASDYSRKFENPVSEEYAWVLFEQAELELIQGDYAAALSYFDRTRNMLALVPEHDSEFDVSVLASTGQAYQLKGDVVNAEAYMRSAIKSVDKLDYDLPLERSTITHNLGALMHELGRYDEAEQLYLTTLEVENRVLADDQAARDIVMTNLGRLYRDMNRFDSAEVFLQMAVDFAKRVHGDTHFFTAYNSKNLADLLRDKQDFEAADTLYQNVIDTYRQVLEPDNPQIASAHLGYAKLLVTMNRHEDAETMSREALRICEASLPEEHWLTATLKSTLADALIGLGDTPETERLLNEAWIVLVASRPEHETTLRVAEQLKRFYRSKGNAERVRYFSSQIENLKNP